MNRYVEPRVFDFRSCRVETGVVVSCSALLAFVVAARVMSHAWTWSAVVIAALVALLLHAFVLMAVLSLFGRSVYTVSDREDAVIVVERHERVGVWRFMQSSIRIEKTDLPLSLSPYGKKWVLRGKLARGLHLGSVQAANAVLQHIARGFGVDIRQVLDAQPPGDLEPSAF